jgi:acetyl esterase
MPIGSDVSAWLVQKSAPFTVRYGRRLYFSGTDLPAPETIRVRTRHGKVRCQVYRPDGASGSYVHLHGGAFLMRYPRMDDWFCRIVAAEVGATVVNVDYDVAPQVRYPVAHEQAHDVLAQVAEDSGGRVAVGGFSAGGNLAASAALQARDRGSCAPVLQLLGVPSLDVAGDPALKQSLVNNPMITPGVMELVRRTYFRDASRRAESYASPLLSDWLSGLAPALVITAEFDRLRAEGDGYAERLADAGVPVEHHVVQTADHYFLEGGRDSARQVLDWMVTALRTALGN